jgi:lactate dehydrogenase-like 2-hydroxyacid dehydrogenase
VLDFPVLVPSPAPSLILEGLSNNFPVLRLWEQEDKAAFIAANAARVRAIAGSFGSTKINAAFMGQFPHLQIISNFGVGYDAVDAAHAGRNGILVTNTPDVLTDEVADLAMGLLLCTVWQLPQPDAYLRAGHWLKAPFPLTATLKGRTMGILGLGRIGKAIAHRAQAFGLKIAYTGRHAQADVDYPFHRDLLSMAHAVDILMVVIPGGQSTRRVVNAEVLAALGPEGILINVARGTVVDEPALITALENKTILSAGLDVFEDEPRVPAALIAMPHVVLLPHVGSASVETRRAMAQLVVDNVVAFASGKGPLTPVAETPWKG